MKFTDYSSCCQAPVLAHNDYRGQFRQLYCQKCGKKLADFRTKAKFLWLLKSLKWESEDRRLYLRCMGVIVAGSSENQWFVHGHPLADVLNLHQCALADGFKSNSESAKSLRRYVKASIAQIIETIPARRPKYETSLRRRKREAP